jgi:hypothetical protein
MLRLLLAILLLIPLPVLAQDVLGEVTVNEGFDDSTYESGLTVSDGSIYCGEQGSYGTTGCSLGINNGTYVFEFSEDVYEVGFIVGAVNNSYDVKYYYSDGTDETIQKSGQDNSEGPPFPSMYDSFYKSFTDYNNDEANTDKFITKFEVTVSDPTVVDTLYWQYVDESTIPTTTTTTTTTIPPTEEELNFAETGIYETNAERKAREEKEAEEARVNAAREWERDKNFQETGIRELDSERREREAIEKEKEETAIRDQQRKANEDKYGCYMTDAQIERGDCEIPEEEPKEEVIIVVDEETKPDTKEELPDDDVVVSEVVVEDEVEKPEPIKEEDIPKEEVKIDVKELEEEFAIEEEVIELPEIIIVEEDVIEDELDKEIPGDDIIREDTVQEEDVKEQDIQEEIVEVISEDLSEEEIEEVVEEFVEQLETEEVIEILEEVVVEEITEEEVVVVQAVVEEAIDNVEELTEEQVEVVAEVLQVETEDVEIIAEAVKEDEVVAEAVEVFVQKAVENKDVEDYTLADVVTEIQFDNFIENPIEVLVDFEDIDLSTIGQDMTSDQKEKAQEVVVPVILTRIASMAAFVFRRTL